MPLICLPDASSHTFRLPWLSILDRLFGLDGRVAVVTGGSSGIGQAMGAALAAAGARVVLIARGADALAAAAARISAAGGAASWVSADLGDRAELARGAGEAAVRIRRAGHPGVRGRGSTCGRRWKR